MTSRSCGKMALGVALCWAAVAAGPVWGQAEPALEGGTAVLGNDSYFRAQFAFKTPILITADGELKTPLDPKSRKAPKPVAEFESPVPPAAWREAAFDDSTWPRQRAPLEVAPASATGRSHAARHSATVSSLICLRGKFVVTDPAKVRDLKLFLEYVGGVAVYVNGKEVTRAHLPAGPLAADTLAAKYPDDLYCEPGGKFLQFIDKNPKGFARRYRRFADVAIPAALLRKGTNVLAVEVHRSPINQAAIPAVRIPVSGMYRVPGIWAYAGIRDLSLTAAPGAAVTPNVARPKGVQVWNCLPFDTIEASDYGDPGEPLRPIAVPAVRNGVFSGRFVVSSDQAMAGLKVTMADLVRSGGGQIPASAVRVRYAAPAVAGKSRNRSYRYDALLDAVPADVPVVKTRLPGYRYLGQPLSRPNLTTGALAPIWITVRVPRDAKPGRYEGTVTVQAAGLTPTAIPVHLTVHNWTLPDPADLRVRNLGFLSPESVAKHYGVPLWSERHFELMGKSMALMTEVNSRQVIVELAIGFHGPGSNRESVVRWIRKPDGSFGHDFTVLDKYLDVVERSIGKPLPIRFNCWGEVAKTGGQWKNVKTVSLLDPATGNVSELEQPPPGTPESYAFWRPVFDGLRTRLASRGWLDVTSIGHNSYCWEQKPEVVGVCKKLWPDGVWSFSAHNGRLGAAFRTTEKSVTMPIRYSECVWTEGRLSARGYRSLVKPRKAIWCTVARNRHRDYSPLTVLRKLPEEMIMRGHDGVGQLGVDIFPIPNPARPGRYSHLAVGRGGLGPDCSTLALLAPGGDGPIPTTRFEMFREGVQLAEAIISLQRALDENKISSDLAERVNRYLDDRAQAFLRHWTGRRFERDERLFALVAETSAGS